MIGYLDLARNVWDKSRWDDQEIVDLLANYQDLDSCACIFLHLTDLRRLRLFAAGDPNCLAQIHSVEHRELFAEYGRQLWVGLLDYTGRIVIYRGEEWEERGRRELARISQQFRQSRPEPAQKPLDRGVRYDKLIEWLGNHLRPTASSGFDEFEAVVRLTLDLELLKQHHDKEDSESADALWEVPGLEILKPLPDLTPIWERLRARSRALGVSARSLNPDLQFLGEFLEKDDIELVIATEYKTEWIKRLSPATGKSGELG